MPLTQGDEAGIVAKLLSWDVRLYPHELMNYRNFSIPERFVIVSEVPNNIMLNQLLLILLERLLIFFFIPFPCWLNCFEDLNAFNFTTLRGDESSRGMS